MARSKVGERGKLKDPIKIMSNGEQNKAFPHWIHEILGLKFPKILK